MKISQILKDKRKELNLTQEELAKNIYVSNKTISNWENEKKRISKSYSLLSISINCITTYL